MIKYINCKLFVLLLLVLGSMQLQAQNNWDGDNALGEFGLCNNWFGDVCPVTWNSTTDLNIRLKNGPQTTMYLNYGAWRDINNLTYFATYTSSVTQFDADGPLFNENGLNFYGKIENYSPNLTQVFNLPFHGRNALKIELNPINGGLTFNRTIFNSGNRNFEVYGPNSRKVTLNGYPEGNGSVGFYIKENSIVEVNYNNVASLSGGYFVEEGELWVESNGVIQGGIQVGLGNANVNKLYISNPSVATTVANAITVAANSTNATIGSLNTSNTHTYSGTINLNNNNVNFDVVSAGGTVNFTNTISGTGGIQKINPGLVRLSAANSYTGNTTINSGTLQYGVADAIANTSNVILNGGRFSTGAAAGFSDTVGTLQLTDNSTIALGTGNHILTFAASNLVAWTPGRTLTITGWTNSCTGAKVFVGNNNTGLTAGQLAQITFQGYAPGASISPIGELIPGNVVLTATGATLIGNYATLKGAFDAINSNTHLGVINISVLNDLNEGAVTAALNQVAGVTSVRIEPAGCGPRTISGTTTAGNALIYLNGADNVTVDGLNTNGNSLTISNTTVSAVANTCTILFQTDATNNTITNCSVLGSATMPVGTAGGNIWFGALPVTTGNDNNTISNCNIGAAGGNLPSKAICFTGFAGTPNNNIVINNNNIYDFFSPTVTSSGIDLINIGTSDVSITNNRFYQTATRTQTSGVIHSCIRIANTSGNNFIVTGNTIGYSSSSGTGTYNFVGVALSVFNPIMMSVATEAPFILPSSIQNNRIVAINHSTSSAGFTTLFQAILVTAGTVNIGNIIGNTIGLPAAPITFNATAGLGGAAFGINMTGTGAVAIQNNTIQSITTTGVPGAAFNVTGINTGGVAVYTITNNTIGNVTPANSINLGVLGTSTAFSTFIGINATSTGTLLNIGASGFSNFIQNITFNASAANVFSGIVTSGSNATTNITYNSIRGVRFASLSATASVCTGINNTTPVSTSVTISNNSLGIAGTDFVTYSAACTGALIGIRNSSGTASPAPVTITNNDIRGISHAGATSSAHTYINNNGGNSGLNLNNNTFTNLNVNTTGTVIFISNSSNTTAASTKNVNNNSIVTGYVRTGATGAVTVFTDNSAAAANSITNNLNNNFSNITIAGTTSMTGWANTDGGAPTKTITGNTFSNWTLGSSAVIVMNIDKFGGASSVSNNTISNITSTGGITGLNIGSTGNATTLDVNANNITTLASSGVGGAVIGLSNAQPVTTLTNNTNTNTISGLSSTGGAVSGITNTSSSPTKNMSNNSIATLSNTASTTTAISSSNGTTVVIDTNTISDISSTSVAGVSIVSGISVTSGAAITITNNPISTLSSANDGSFRGIYVSPLGATSNTISGNTVNGMTSTSTGLGFSVRAIEVQGTNNATISLNTISNINSPTTNVTAGVGTPIVGLYYGSSGAASTITGNTISSINATTAGAINVSVAAMVTANTAAGGTITKNRIYGLTNSKSGALANTIGFVPNGGNWTFANNMISITNNNTVRAIGVFDAGAAGARNYHYNSIYIGGTHAGTQVSNAFQYNALAGATADIKNNIFVMERVSGAKNYAFANTSANFTGVTTNYNVLNCSVAATVGLTNATDRTFDTWKTTSGGDANSYSGIAVPFTNTAIADLHIVAGCTDIESGGTPVAILDDYDAAARSVTTPDIGADEFAGTKPADITLTPNTPICLGNNTTLTASSTDLTYVYTWSPATGLSATTGASVIATPIVTTTYIVTGTSPSSCIKTKEVIVTVNPLPAAITVSPNSVALCPNVIQAFTAAPNTGTGTVGTFAGVLSVAANTPYRQGTTTEVKIQYLITKAELHAAGIAGGNFTSIAFNVTTAQPAPMTTYDLRMANTTATVLTTTYLTPAFTNVFSAANLVPTLGVNTHTFSTPFAWDGTSNVVVEIRHTGTAGIASTVQVITPSVTSTISRTGGGTFAALTGTTNPNRPVITFGFENPITWSPVTELYTDATASTVYNPLVHLNQPTIYAKSSIARVYTATLTTVGTGCTRTSTGTITFAGSTWDGTSWSPSVPTGNSSLTFTGDYTSSGNLSGCSCTVTGGNVVFNGPDTLILDDGLTVTAPGTLKFNNNASLVQINDAATNSGIITVERITQPMYRFDYTYWGSPLTLASNFTLGGVGGLSPDTLSDKYFSWIPTVSNAGGNWAYETAATVMDPLKGYCVRAPQTFSPIAGTTTPYTANFVGTPNNGIISAPIYHGTLALGVNDDKYNLLGNPYPSALDAQAFLTDPANVPVIDGTIYFWTHNSPISASNANPFYGTFALNYNNNDYAAWNSLGAVGFRGILAGTGGVMPSGFIASGQGFFAKSTGTAATGTPVTFNNSMRVAGNNNVFFRNSTHSVDSSRSENSTAEKSRIWLDLISSSGSFSQILVGYLPGATLDYDRMYDGVPIDESGMLLYSTVPDRKLIIQGRPTPFEVEDQVALGFKSIVQDTYSIGLDAVDGLFETQDIYIEDRQLNIIHDLKASPYTFTSEAGTFNERFVLRYTDTSLDTSEFDANQNVTAFIFNHELQVKSSQNIVAIELFDISGKLIQKYNPSEVTNEFITRFGFAQGVYLAKIKLDNGVEVTKKVIH